MSKGTKVGENRKDVITRGKTNGKSTEKTGKNRTKEFCNGGKQRRKGEKDHRFACQKFSTLPKSCRDSEPNEIVKALITVNEKT